MRLNLSVKRKHISVLYKMMAYILLPIIILSVANIYINTYHVRFYENNVVENYTSSLSALSVNINDSLRQVLSTADLMSVDANITSILYDYSSASEPNVDVTYGAIETLRKFKSTLDFIDCISVVNRQSGYVVSDSGKTAADYYFNTGYRYEDYPETFWKNLSIPTAGYMLLPPVNVSTKAGKKVIPLISAGFNNIKSQNLIIINLSSEKFSEILLNNLWTKGNIFIVDESYKIFTSGHPASPAEAMFRQEGFLSGLHSETPFKYRYGDNEYVVVTYKDEATVFSKISFVAVASMRDLLYDFNRIRAIMNLLNAVLMIFAVFAAYKISKKLYSPILGLVNSLNGSDYFTKTDNMNEYDYLDRQIQKMLKTNSTMQRQLSATMPLACEQFIYKLLISAAPPTDADIDEFLSNNNMAFDLKFFTVISIKTVYSKKFYKSFTQSQYHAINIGIYNIFKFMFNDVYPSYIISPEGETLFLIINTHNENDDFDNIVAAFEDTVRAFQNDYELIDVSIGIGKPREGYEGIHRSYTEASEAQVMIAAYNEKKVMVYSEAHKVTNQYSYTIDDDNKLFNYMAKGSPEDTRALINDVLKRNLADGVGDAGIKLLYQKLYHTAVKALQTKGITPPQLMEDDFINIDLGITTLETDKFISYINDFITETLLYTNSVNTKFDIEAIIKYIDDNFTSDIYLDQLAEQFGTSPKYLSRIIKNYLGMGFGQYVASLRIGKAKHMLTRTNSNINDIVIATGFNSHNTFIRTFKKLEGIVPSEYRNIFSNGKEKR